MRHNDGTFGYWSDAYFGKLKAEIQKASGVQFSLKTFRATFALMAKNKGASIEAVSRALRHRNTMRTERY